MDRPTIKFPKVLVSSPTASAKNYCFEQWLDNVMGFKYPNFDIRLFDNTQDGGKNAERLVKIYEERYGKTEPKGKFYAWNSMELHNKQRKDNVISRMALSHNDCRLYALHNGYDYLLHLESDVFPEFNVIETLMSHKKKVVGGLFYRDEGRHRCAMVQRRVYVTPNNIKVVNLDAWEDLPLLDGTIKEVASVGLGCVLIETKKVFTKLEFRHIEGNVNHPDSFFSEDCFRNKIPIFVDSNVVCRHDNRKWGIYGIDFK